MTVLEVNDTEDGLVGIVAGLEEAADQLLEQEKHHEAAQATAHLLSEDPSLGKRDQLTLLLEQQQAQQQHQLLQQQRREAQLDAQRARLAQLREERDRPIVRGSPAVNRSDTYGKNRDLVAKPLKQVFTCKKCGEMYQGRHVRRKLNFESLSVPTFLYFFYQFFDKHMKEEHQAEPEKDDEGDEDDDAEVAAATAATASEEEAGEPEKKPADDPAEEAGKEEEGEKPKEKEGEDDDKEEPMETEWKPEFIIHAGRGRTPPPDYQEFECPRCDMIASTEKDIKEHIDKEHKPKPRLPCNECGRDFARKWELQV